MTKHNLKIPTELTNRAKPLIMAHRGNRAQAPENSMAAFRLALGQGAHILETDLRITRDRVIICFHDATVERTTNSTGLVAKMTWEELKMLKLRGNGDDVHPNERIPTLAEILAELAPHTYFALEFKEPAFEQPEDVELLMRVLEERNAVDRVIGISFSRRALRCAERMKVPFPLAHIAAFGFLPSPKYPLVGAWWPLLFLNPFYVAISHQRGQICCPLDPTPEPRLPFYLFMGMDAVLTDNPLLTRETLETLRA